MGETVLIQRIGAELRVLVDAGEDAKGVIRRIPVSQAILEFIELGCADVDACEAVDVPKGTFYRWLAHGEDEIARNVEGEYRIFRDAVQRARARGKVNLHGRIVAASIDGPNHPAEWKAAAWLLERRWPESYGRRDVMEHIGRNGAPIQIQPAHSEEVILEAARSIQERRQSTPALDAPVEKPGANGTKT